MKLLLKLIRKDFKRNRVITTALAVFLILSALLMAGGLLKRMEIEGIEERDIREVSGGQLQRASICRAMINNPEILFLDEPTGALNSGAADQVLAILEDLNRDGMIIMTVTHDQRVAAKARKVLYIRDGQIASCKEFSVGADRERELDEWVKGFQSKARI